MVMQMVGVDVEVSAIEECDVEQLLRWSSRRGAAHK